MVHVVIEPYRICSIMSNEPIGQAPKEVFAQGLQCFISATEKLMYA